MLLIWEINAFVLAALEINYPRRWKNKINGWPKVREMAINSH